jgi:hypothetical protein
LLDLHPRLVNEAGQLYVGVITGRADCGSGPHQGYVLLSHEEGEWIVTWNATEAFAGLIGQTGVEFLDEGLNTIQVHGTSYGRSDAKSSILSEHKLAPVRSFDQVWVRQGEAYVLTEESVGASGSNTLLEFIYRLSSEDQAAASALVTDASIVITAQSLGLVRGPEDPTTWYWFCTDKEGRSFGPFIGWPCVLQRPDGSSLRFTFVQSSDDWLISAIEPCTYTYGGGGGRCD